MGAEWTYMKKTIFLALLLMLWLVTPARAVQGTMTANRSEIRVQKEQVQEAREETKENREELRQKRCDLIESRINFRTNQYEQNRDKHYNLYQGVRKRIGDLVAKLEGKSCDVTTLKAELTKFDSLIAEFAAAFRDFNTTMQATKEYRCGESEGKFASSAQTARQKNQVMREKALAVKTYFKQTIQPELSQKVKACLASPKPSASSITEGVK